MITWHKETLIHANIDKIWTLFNIENLSKIMPQVVFTTIVNKEPNIVGSTYRQVYKV